MKYYKVTIRELDGDKTLTRRYSDIFFEDDNEFQIGEAIKEMHAKINE